MAKFTIAPGPCLTAKRLPNQKGMVPPLDRSSIKKHRNVASGVRTRRLQKSTGTHIVSHLLAPVSSEMSDFVSTKRLRRATELTSAVSCYGQGDLTRRTPSVERFRSSLSAMRQPYVSSICRRFEGLKPWGAGLPTEPPGGSIAAFY